MPSATAREFQRVAAALGFVKRRQTGSHERWTHSDGRSVTIPFHGGRDIGPPLFFDSWPSRRRSSTASADEKPNGGVGGDGLTAVAK
jgi:predicted RNA binding protein YcfA (HicA-like mRNA interferase family)